MSRAPHKSKKREAWRAANKVRGPVRTPGKGHAVAREAKRCNLSIDLARKKVAGRAAREFEKLSDGELQTRLSDARKELFRLRFRRATGQLEDTAQPGRLRRRIARILTIIRQKETVSHDERAS
jgi:large subunit ribosomal protein L29